MKQMADLVDLKVDNMGKDLQVLLLLSLTVENLEKEYIEPKVAQLLVDMRRTLEEIASQSNPTYDFYEVSQVDHHCRTSKAKIRRLKY
jgi:hypothetical protein